MRGPMLDLERECGWTILYGSRGELEKISN